MSDEQKSKGWWNTLPGIITSLTATITAVAGLVVAIKQTGWFGPPTSGVPTETSSKPPRAIPGAPPPSFAPNRPPAAAASPASPHRASHSVVLPALRDYKLGPTFRKATFTLLSAELSPQTSEKDALRIQIRMINHDNTDTNFWDNSFRLIVDGLPMAPESNLNELVPGRSAKDGAVIFVIPRETAGANLEITYYEDKTTIPLALSAPR